MWKKSKKFEDRIFSLKRYYVKNVISNHRTTRNFWNWNAQTSMIQSNKFEHVRKTDWTRFLLKKIEKIWWKFEKIQKENYIFSLKRDITLKLWHQIIAPLEISETWMHKLVWYWVINLNIKGKRIEPSFS